MDGETQVKLVGSVTSDKLKDVINSILPTEWKH
jgi:hypothetical protein